MVQDVLFNRSIDDYVFENPVTTTQKRRSLDSTEKVQKEVVTQQSQLIGNYPQNQDSQVLKIKHYQRRDGNLNADVTFVSSGLILLYIADPFEWTQCKMRIIFPNQKQEFSRNLGPLQHTSGILRTLEISRPTKTQMHANFLRPSTF